MTSAMHQGGSSVSGAEDEELRVLNKCSTETRKVLPRKLTVENKS